MPVVVVCCCSLLMFYFGCIQSKFIYHIADVARTVSENEEIGSFAQLASMRCFSAITFRMFRAVLFGSIRDLCLCLCVLYQTVR